MNFEKLLLFVMAFIVEIEYVVNLSCCRKDHVWAFEILFYYEPSLSLGGRELLGLPLTEIKLVDLTGYFQST